LSRNWLNWIALILVYLGTVIGSWQVQQARFEQTAALLADSTDLVVEFQLRSEPRLSVARYASDQEQVQYSVMVKLIKVESEKFNVQLTAPATALVQLAEFNYFRGQTLRASATFISTVTNARSCCLIRITTEPDLIRSANWAYSFANNVRTGLRQAIPNNFHNGAALVPGLVLGDTSGQSVELAAAMRGSGLAHLTAVSGGNVTIVLGLVIAVFILIGTGNRGLIFASAIALAGYVLIVGFDASVLRAGAMGSITLLAILSKRAITTGAILLGATYLLTVFNPWLWLSWGFLLSVTATASLIWFAPKLLLAMPWRPPIDLLAALIGATVAASWLTAPLVALLTGEVPMVAILANLIAAPLVASTTVFGLIAALFALIHPALATPIGFLASMPAELIGQIALRTAALPGAQLEFASASSLLFFISSVFLIAILLARAAARKLILISLLGFMLSYPALIAVGRSVDGWPPKDTFLIACDVGQGTAILLPVAKRTAVVIDTGPAPQPINQCLSRAGFNQIAAIFISHFHSDHAGGIAGVLMNRTAGAIYVSNNPNPTHQSSAVRDIAAQREIPVSEFTAGKTLQIGAYLIESLWPLASQISQSENDASLILRITSKENSFLFTGDIEPTGQAQLMRQLRVDVTAALVPHHGSKFQHPDFAAWTGASLGIISVGDNRFGHPAKSTIGNWQKTMQLVRTDVAGDIALVSNATGLIAVGR
jgi:competence protein ComEC